jgi:DNA-binding NtrC family response regulator
MKRLLSALIVHEDENVMEYLRGVLQDRGVVTRCAHTCLEAKASLSRRTVPGVVFTGEDLTDGSWREVMTMARAANPPAEVVLALNQLGPFLDSDGIKVYLDAMDQGAFDVIVFPLAAGEVARIVRSACIAVIARRGLYVIERPYNPGSDALPRRPIGLSGQQAPRRGFTR